MPSVAVTITHVVDDEFPFFVTFEMQDCMGEVHVFRDKLPIVDDGAFDAMQVAEVVSKLPAKGKMRCSLLHRAGKFIEISTVDPDGLESTLGLTDFRISAKAFSEE